MQTQPLTWNDVPLEPRQLAGGHVLRLTFWVALPASFWIGLAAALRVAYAYPR